MIRSIAMACCAALLIPGGASAAQERTATAANGMIVTAEPHATQAGLAVLEAGGNAFDAAAAVGFALAVTYPRAGNIGGGGFCVGLTAEGEVFALDFRERAPAAAHRDMYLDDAGDVIAGKSTATHQASGVPGTTDGLLLLRSKYGTMGRAAVLYPAIRLAEDGFALPAALDERLKENPAAASAFFPGGRSLAQGETLRQPDLAKTLRAISARGRAGFYEGEVADLIAAEMERGGGLITREDLRDYATIEREPYTFQAGGYELITMPLPSSGGITMAQILGLLDLDGLRRAGRNSPAYVSALTEAERLAYADRNYFLGDTDYVDVPVARLTSAGYLNARRGLIPEGRAGSSAAVGHGEPRRGAESEETTHYTIVDRWGNVAAVTYTLNGSYGSGIAVEGAGFLLNNEMDDFSAKPGVPNMYGLTGAEANAIEPGKRMLSSMTPTIVRRGGEFAFTVGSPGGSTIITTVVQVFLNVTQFGMTIDAAIDDARFHHQWLPDTIQYDEGGLPADAMAPLRAMGYTLAPRDPIGMAAGIQRLPDGRLLGHADRRGYGTAAGPPRFSP